MKYKHHFYKQWNKINIIPAGLCTNSFFSPTVTSPFSLTSFFTAKGFKPNLALKMLVSSTDKLLSPPLDWVVGVVSGGGEVDILGGGGGGGGVSSFGLCVGET